MIDGILDATEYIPFSASPQKNTTTYLSEVLFIHQAMLFAIKGRL